MGSASTRSRWVFLLCLGVGATASAGDAFTRVDGQVIAPLPEDPTTVFGLDSYPVGFDSNLVPGTSGAAVTAPLATGTTGIVALRYRIDAPVSGTTWQAVFTRPGTATDSDRLLWQAP